MDPRRFIALSLATAALVLAAVAVFDWWVDPFAYFGRFPYGVYNDGQSRHLKVQALKRYRADAVLFGASTGEHFDPDQVEGCRLYNASFSGGRIPEIRYFVENHLPDVRLVVLTLDYHTVNGGHETPESLHPAFGRITVRDTVANLISLNAAGESIRTLRRHRQGREWAIQPNGQRETRLMLADDAQRAGRDYDRYFKATLALYRPWAYSTERIADLEAIRDALAARGIPVVVVVNPQSEGLVEWMKAQGVYGDLARFRADVLRVFPDAHDFSEAPEFQDWTLFYKHDPLHFTPATGARMLHKALAGNPVCR